MSHVLVLFCFMTLIESRSIHPLQSGRAPDWATAWGEDRFGPWVEFEYQEVVQRLRWIPSGSFMMGSPESEAGRAGEDDTWNEGPAHSVTLTQPFWVFDTACTQAHWEAAMGSNPSRFVHPERPVERVSWDDVQTYLAKINAELPGLDLSLPTEAQWEFACRAQTRTATWLGDLDILGDANAPLLDSISWYGGNCGVDFDLDNGEAITWLQEKQYDFTHGGTRIVKQKDANPWGLYDMLGNVWEWCQDGWREYTAEPQTDPVGDGADRVLRGGGWNCSAHYVRAACRSWIAPVSRNDLIGFRCARVHSGD